MTLTLSSLITSVTGLVGGLVPDLAVFIAGGVVIAMAAYLFRRFVPRGR